ncbi:MAG TPA: copper amine oxidase N-terminal domain-containing protein [Paenibacillus sp.]|nr:copper amine oxidase N-terminal domain-containing protein [Paenibacillus sp.]
MKMNMNPYVRKTIAVAAMAACIALPALTTGGHSAESASTPAVSLTLNQGAVQLKHTPLLEGGAVYLPLRETGALLGSRTTWIAEGKRILVNSPGIRVEMTLGSKQAKVNGKAYVLTAMPKNVGGVVFVPVRFVSEALGASVQWNAKDRRVELRFDNAYAFVEKGARGYWLQRNTGELYVSENGQAAALAGDTEFKLQRYVELSVETLSAGTDVVTATDNYGEPGINNDVYRFVVASGKLTAEAKTHYWGVHPIRNVKATADGHSLLMDGAALSEVDASGAVMATHVLKALTGYEDEAFQVEWYDAAFMIVRPHTTGWLTLVDRKTGKATRLADALLDEKQLEAYRTMPPNELDFANWDGLRVVGLEGNVLKLKHQWFLDGGKEVDLTYTIES